MGADNVQEVPGEFAGAYLSVAFMAFMFFALTQVLAEINKGVNKTATDEGIEQGTVGSLLLLMMGAGAILAVTTLNAEWKDRFGEKLIHTDTFNRKLFVGGDPRHKSPAALGRSSDFYDPSITKKRKQNYWEGNVRAVGLASLVGSGKSHFKLGKDEYDVDHDYSKDAYRKGEEEQRAREARKLSERIKRERQRQEEIQAKRPIVQVMQTPAYPQTFPQQQYYYPPPPQHQLVAPAPAPAVNPAPHSNKAVAHYGDDGSLLPPYPPGHPLRDDRPYGILFVMLILAWVAVLEAMRRKYFIDAEGNPRKPTQEEGMQVELVRTAGSVVLGMASFMFVQTFLNNNPGSGSTTVAAVAAIVVSGVAYMGSGQLVDIYSKVHSTPPQCLKFKPDQFRDDPDYIEYEKLSLQLCTQKKEEAKPKSWQQLLGESFSYYLPFWSYMLAFILTLVAIGFLARTSSSDMIQKGVPLMTGVIIFIAFFSMIIIPLGGYELPWFEKPKTKDEISLEEKADAALARLSAKLTTRCPNECTPMCHETLNVLLKYARRAC